MAHTSLECSFRSLRFVGIHLCAFPFRSLKSISFGLCSEFWLRCCNILQHLHSFLFQPLRIWSLSRRMTKFLPSFSRWTDGLTFDSVVYRGVQINDYKARRPCSCKTAQITTPSPLCLTAGIKCLCWRAVFGFLLNVTLCCIASPLLFVFVCPKDNVP